MTEISTEAAARFELMLAAADRGNRSLAVGMLLSIPEGELETIRRRLSMLGLDPVAMLGSATERQGA